MKSMLALAREWQADAAESARLMEAMDTSGEYDEEQYAYWRGRRDAFETAALQVFEQVDDAKRSGPKVIR